LSGSQFLCDGDTTTLLVAEADSYFWNPGNESTQTIDVSQTGLYSVTVTYDSLGCVSTSPEINIIKNDLPTASFVLDKYEIIQNVDTEINMTDLSVNTSSWFWKLSDGQTSTEQNPVFTINSIDPIEVILTATSSEGCQDDDIQVIDVITGIEDPKLTGALKLYPNPASGIINVEFTNEYYGTFDINIYNTVGKTVRKMKIPKNGKYSHNAIDLNGLPKGLYLIKVDLDSFGQSTSRILLR
jgi:PKD repeat protein